MDPNAWREEPIFWRLEGTEPVPEPDLRAWAAWFANIDNRRVALTQIAPAIAVSTVFLGMNHAVIFGDPPLLFETMVCRDGAWDETVRYATWHAAEQGHELMVARVRAALGHAEERRS